MYYIKYIFILEIPSLFFKEKIVAFMDRIFKKTTMVFDKGFNSDCF
jgi:hypothetical protein